MIDIEGLQYELVHESFSGTQVWEPIPKQTTFTRVAIDSIPEETTTLTDARVGSITRSANQSSVFRTSRGGSVIR